MEFNYPPIEVLSQDNSSVTFGVSQMWKEEHVCLLAVDYESPSMGETCDTHNDVPAGTVAYYTAVCVDGYATATIYVQDSIFGAGNSVANVPASCSPLVAGDYTIEYIFSIPCVIEAARCPVPEAPVCDGTDSMAIATENFNNGEAMTWLYGAESFANGVGFLDAAGTFLGGSEGSPEGLEISKTFKVPPTASGITLQFTLLEVQNKTDAKLRLANSYFVIGSFANNQVESHIQGFLGDVWTTISGISPTSNIVTMVIPQKWFSSGFITVAYSAAYGVVDFSITAVCKSSLQDYPLYGPGLTMAPTSSPTSAPTVDCVPNIKYTTTGARGSIYPPVEVFEQNNDTVTFSISQTWADHPMCQIAVAYTSPWDGYTCDSQNNVPPGELGYYKAVCVDGVATVTLYAEDFIFGASATVSDVPTQCAPFVNGGHSIKYTLSIPCNLEATSCPRPEMELCHGSEPMNIANETFEDGSASTWLFGSADNSPMYGTYLALGDTIGLDEEMAKTFNVPIDSGGVLVQFDLIELNDISDLLVRINGKYFDLGAFDTTTEESASGFLGDVYTVIAAQSNTVNRVSMIIPSGWYNIGRLTFGFGGMDLVDAGVDNLFVQGICVPLDTYKGTATSPGYGPNNIKRRDEEMTTEEDQLTDEDSLADHFPVNEPADEPEFLDGSDSSGETYCSAEDFPCGDDGSKVYVCHYSARSGYKTYCVPEHNSEILRFYPNDYCGPCVGDFGGVDQE